jgi:hypothetical protein
LIECSPAIAVIDEIDLEAFIIKPGGSLDVREPILGERGVLQYDWYSMASMFN